MRLIAAVELCARVIKRAAIFEAEIPISRPGVVVIRAECNRVSAIFALLAVCLLLASCGSTSAKAPGGLQPGLSVSPTSLAFGNQTVGTTSAAQSVSVTNTGNAMLNISSADVIPPEFQLASGNTQQSLAPRASATYSLTFTPDSAKSFSGQLSFTSDAPNSPAVVSLSGTGATSGAVAKVSPTSIGFGNVPEGTASAPQAVTVTNAGSTTFTVTAVMTSAPFTVVGFTVPAMVAPGMTFTFQVTFRPSTIENFTGTVTISYDVLTSSGVSLSGTGTNPTALTIITTSPLPSGTQGAAYLAFLEAAGGTPPYTWLATLGSMLPTGLALSADGTISGSTNTATTGSFSFTVQVTDSKGAAVSAALTLPVGAATGANCNNIFIDIGNPTPGSNSPGPHVIPLIDMGATNTYFGAVGGLYGTSSNPGSNVRPAAYDALGASIANSIVLLDANGNPDPTNGKIVLLSIGMSNASTEFGTFAKLANADPAKNPNLVLVNGAQPGQTAGVISDPGAAFWSNIINTILPAAGVTANQVVAAWVKEADQRPTGTFPGDMATLQSQYETIAQILLQKFPNIKLAYYSSRIYAGFSNGISTLNPEPFAFESAFAVRGAVQDFINGKFSGAPWLSWGPYLWANGMLPRSDGMEWTCQDFIDDGAHPSTAGARKVDNMLLDFFKTDDTTAPWFLAH